MSFFTMIKFAAIAFSLLALAETAPVNSRSSEKALNRKLGKWSGSVRLPLIHIYSERSPFRPANRTWESLISETIKPDPNRLLFLKRTSRSSKVDPKVEDAKASIPVMSGSGEYITQVNFGTPNQSMYTLIDTGSDVAWIPCKPCEGCDSTANRPPFDPAMSSSYKSLVCDSQPCQQISSTNCGENSECDVELMYGDGSELGGQLSSDAITLGSQYLPNFSFVCTDSVNGLVTDQPGLMGLGGGSVSLLNQPTAELFGGTFSYCLPTLESSASSGSGSLVLGKEAALSTPALQFTTLLKDPLNPTFYYVSLMGISVGNTKVSVPATSIANGEGTIIDSGTTITQLVAPLYMALRDAFRAQIPIMRATPDESFDTCYDISSSSVDVPSITLHLDRNVDLVLPEENIVIKRPSGLMCLAFFSTSDSLSIIGNVQQQNWRIVFDVPNTQVGFAKEQCNVA